MTKESIGSTLLPEIQRLKTEQATLRMQRQKVAKELKNAERKRSRLKKRAKLLSDDDLVAVMMLRVAEKKDAQHTDEGQAAGSTDLEEKGDAKEVIPDTDMAGPNASPAEIVGGK